MDTERFEAVGQRGEACIILRRRSTLSNGQPVIAWNLASGERIAPAEGAGEFKTLDGARTFKLRRAP
jgi:hypothetical protein